jgi:C1A family cysteine protease
MMNAPSGAPQGVADTKKCTGAQIPTDNLPETVDWTAKGGVTPVKNQGQCGSCWAFSTTGALEGEYFRTQGSLQSFSEQQLVDCSKSYGNGGCNGGLMNMSFWYVIDHGITNETQYPYKAAGSTCKYTDAQKVWGISNCVDVTVNVEKALLASIAHQPTSVAIEADHASFQLYKSGVYSGNCGTKLDHGVLAVGYGEQSGKTFIKVKNSWGSSWGSQGYIYIARKGDGKGQCGINMAASFAIA